MKPGGGSFAQRRALPGAEFQAENEKRPAATSEGAGVEKPRLKFSRQLLLDWAAQPHRPGVIRAAQVEGGCLPVLWEQSGPVLAQRMRAAQAGVRPARVEIGCLQDE